METWKCRRRRRKRRMRGREKQGNSLTPAPSRHCERRSRTEE